MAVMGEQSNALGGLVLPNQHFNNCIIIKEQDIWCKKKHFNWSFCLRWFIVYHHTINAQCEIKN